MTAINAAVADGDNTKNESPFSKRIRELVRRHDEGTLPGGPIAMALQDIIEGNFAVSGLLKYVGCLKLKAVSRFVVADNFKVGNIVGGRKIAWIGDNFHEHFDSLVEENVPERVVPIWELIKGTVDKPAIKILGGEGDPNTETHLAHTFQMMELGEKGKGRLDGYANFGYKRSPKDGKLWVPGWYVHDGGFGVGASSSSYPLKWSGGYRVSGG